MTYQIVISRLKEIILAHKFINEYGYGNISDIAVPEDKERPNYPYAFINPVSTTLGERSFEANFNLIVMTQVLDSEDDELFGQSNCMKYINDVLSQFVLTNNDPLLSVSFPVNMTPFKERFQDDVVGATANVTITYGKAMSVCDSPITAISPSTPYCPQVLVTDGDESVHLVDAGDSYTCLPATAKSGILYQRPNIGITQRSLRDGDHYWQIENGLLPYPADPNNPETYARPALDNSYDTNFRGFALLENDNIFGNKYRWTNTVGKQGSAYTGYSRPQFHYVNDWDNAIHGYVIDHLTGLAWTAYAQNPPNGIRNTGTVTHGGVEYQRERYQWQSCADYSQGLNGEEQFNMGGFRDWRIPTFHEAATFFSAYDGIQFGYAWAGVSAEFGDEALNYWYNVLGETGNPPRTGAPKMWSSNFWSSNPLILDNYSMRAFNPNSTIPCIFVRNHY